MGPPAERHWGVLGIVRPVPLLGEAARNLTLHGNAVVTTCGCEVLVTLSTLEVAI